MYVLKKAEQQSNGHVDNRDKIIGLMSSKFSLPDKMLNSLKSTLCVMSLRFDVGLSHRYLKTRIIMCGKFTNYDRLKSP